MRGLYLGNDNHMSRVASALLLLTQILRQSHVLGFWNSRATDILSISLRNPGELLSLLEAAGSLLIKLVVSRHDIDLMHIRGYLD